MYSKKMCTVYRMFKTNFKFEEYIDKIDVKDRISLSKFRCRNNYLPIVKFTYTKVEEDKYCTLCNSRETGDEIHYLFKCTALNEERKKCFNKEHFRHVNIFTVSNIMNCKSASKLKKLSKFAKVIMSKFK